jgi:hypothetical protein
MFDPILELQRRRRMQPQVMGNIQPPDTGPDISPAPVPQMMPMPMQTQAPQMTAGPDFSGVAQLGAERGMDYLMKRLRKPEANADALKSLPVLKNLFRR